jgi:hypothetical protein
MLAQPATTGLEVQNASAKLAAGELVELVGSPSVDAICISVVTPPPSFTRAIFARNCATACDLKIVVGLWARQKICPTPAPAASGPWKSSLPCRGARRLGNSCRLGETLPAPLHADEVAPGRVASCPLDTDEPVFDHGELARIFDVQLALIMLVIASANSSRARPLGRPSLKTRQIPRRLAVIRLRAMNIICRRPRARRFAAPLVLARGSVFMPGVPLARRTASRSGLSIPPLPPADHGGLLKNTPAR